MSDSSRLLMSMQDVSGSTPASSNTRMAGLITNPVSITCSTSANAMTTSECTWQPGGQYRLHEVLPAHSDDLESGEEELEQEGEDPIPHLARCIESLRGIPEYQEWDS